MQRLFNLFRKKEPKRNLSPLHETGFHGDQYLLDWTDEMLKPMNNFIETGANVGSTLRYVATNYPHLTLYSCEPDSSAFQAAKTHTKGMSHVHLYQKLSPQFLYDLFDEYPHLASSDNFYWLDAHDYGYEWPLHDEIAFITSATERGIIAIDDAKVPSHSEFKYCTYDGQSCDLDYITNALTADKVYQVGYANYTEKTSPHHPLVGVIFVAYGGLILPEHTAFTIKTIQKE